MPYPTIESLPDPVKQLLPKKQRQWRAIWNSVFSRCTDKGGDPKKCEGQAFAQAWGVVGKKLKMSEAEITKAIEESKLQKWDESEHPRAEEGSSDGGQFVSSEDSGSGGGEKTPSVKTGGRISIKDYPADAKEITPEMRMAQAKYSDIRSNMSKNLRVISEDRAKLVPVVGKMSEENAGRIIFNANEQLHNYTGYLAGDTTFRARDYVDRVGTILRDPSLKDLDAGSVDAMMQDSVQKLVYQEVESNRQQFTDHGIRHLVGNALRADDIMVKMSDGQVSAEDRLAQQFIMVNHDIGYTSPLVREGGLRGIMVSGDHKIFSAAIAEEQRAQWNEGKIFSKAKYDQICNVIKTHDDTTIDFKGDLLGTSTRVSDNLSLFNSEKLPGMFHYVKGGELHLTQMGQAAAEKDFAKFDKLRDGLSKKIDSSNLSTALKRDLKASVKELNYMTPKFTLGVLAGHVTKIDKEGDLLAVTIKHDPFDAFLQKHFDMGQNKTDKLLKDYGIKDYTKTEYDLGGKMKIRVTGVKLRKDEDTEIGKDAIIKSTQEGQEMQVEKAATEGSVFLTLPISKVDQERRMVYGTMTTEDLDKQGDIVDYDAAKKAVEIWPKNIREMHDTTKAVGSAVEIMPNDAQRKIDIGVYISKGAQSTWEKLLDGTLKGFSIGVPHGRYRREPCEVQKGAELVKANRLFCDTFSEASLVDNPANAKATVYLVKSADGGLVTTEAVGILEAPEMTPAFKKAVEVGLAPAPPLVEKIEPVAEVEKALPAFIQDKIDAKKKKEEAEATGKKPGEEGSKEEEAKEKPEEEAKEDKKEKSESSDVRKFTEKEFSAINKQGEDVPWPTESSPALSEGGEIRFIPKSFGEVWEETEEVILFPMWTSTLARILLNALQSESLTATEKKDLMQKSWDEFLVEISEELTEEGGTVHGAEEKVEKAEGITTNINLTGYDQEKGSKKLTPDFSNLTAEQKKKMEEETAKKVEGTDLEKIGRRNNAADQAKIQAMHDHACDLGADCKVPENPKPVPAEEKFEAAVIEKITAAVVERIGQMDITKAVSVDVNKLLASSSYFQDAVKTAVDGSVEKVTKEVEGIQEDFASLEAIVTDEIKSVSTDLKAEVTNGVTKVAEITSKQEGDIAKVTEAVTGVTKRLDEQAQRLAVVEKAPALPIVKAVDPRQATVQGDAREQPGIDSEIITLTKLVDSTQDPLTKQALGRELALRMIRKRQ